MMTRLNLGDRSSRAVTALLALVAGLVLAGCATSPSPMKTDFHDYSLDYSTPTDAALQASLERIDGELRRQLGLTSEQAAVGLLDLRTLRLAMIHPDRIEYAASVPKVAILLAWFQLHPDAATNLDSGTRHEFGLMIKQSSNEIAAKYSQEIGLTAIRQVLDRYHFYDATHGGGLWLGKHYGQGGERLGDPVGDHSHAATVRQLLRFYLLLEQGRLVSPAASQTMREIFASPDIPALDDRFVRALAGRGLQVLRKSGWWEDWYHDSAVIEGAGRHYLLVALTHHAQGNAYLVGLARAVDDLLSVPLPGR